MSSREDDPYAALGGRSIRRKPPPWWRRSGDDDPRYRIGWPVRRKPRQRERRELEP